MTTLSALRPPPEFEALRWHWITNTGPQETVVEWRHTHWRLIDFYYAYTPHELARHGWTYLAPCVPPIPTTDADVERVARALAPKAWAAFGKIGIYGLAQVSRRTASLRHARAAIAAMKTPS